MIATALRALVFAGVAALGAAGAAAQQAAVPPFQAGKHYTVLTPPQPTSTEPGKVEVAEIFMFGCPGCFGFEPYIEAWLEHKPDYINFVRVPAQWSSHPESPLHARAYYTAEALGKLGTFEQDFFNEVHKNGNLLDTEPKLVAFFAAHGVDEAAFKSTLNSFAVNAKLKRAADLEQRYRVQSTPSVVVNGKYLTVGRMAGSVEAWFAIIEELAAREHAAASSAAAAR
ncbi:MAG TPA: thiol:disulfide interchange protein DsbA/DsbL [Gammaproteobacteria bacterium]